MEYIEYGSQFTVYVSAIIYMNKFQTKSIPTRIDN